MNNEQNIIHRFRRYLRLERSYSVNTIDAYMRDIDKLVRFLRSASPAGVPDDSLLLRVRQADLQAFLASLFGIGISHVRRHAY